MTKTNPIVRCMDCRHAMLVRYAENNPVCSVCRISKEKDVASRRHTCPYFERTNKPNEIANIYEAF